MINSMTGYGRARGKDAKGASVTVDIKSVNNRHLTVSCRMPDSFLHKSQEIEALIRKEIARGSVTYFLKVDLVSRCEYFDVDTALLQKYLRTIRKLQKKTGLASHLSVETVMNLPGVITSGESQVDMAEKLWPLIVKTTRNAVDKLKKMRREEGKNIAADLRSKLKTMRALLGRIRSRVPAVIQSYRKRLLERTRQLLEGTGVSVEESDLVRELAFFAERSSIEEEVIRFDSHLKQVKAVLRSPEPVGRQLEFLSQEMLREANTMASKAAEAALAQIILGLKNEVAAVREQVFNIE